MISKTNFALYSCQYQYLTPKKSSNILSFSSIFLYSDFSGLRTLSLLNWTFFKSLKLMALLLNFLDYSRTLRYTSWLLASWPVDIDLWSLKAFESSSFWALSLIFIYGSEFTEELTLSYLERFYPSLGEMSLAASTFFGSLLL